MIRRHRVRYEIPGQARFLTFSCFHQLPLFKNDAIKDEIAGYLEACHAKQTFELFAWVIMPEHTHLLLRPNLPEYVVPEILRQLKEPFARAVLHRWEELKAPILDRLHDKRYAMHFWQRGGGYDRNIDTEEKFFEKIEYIHGNPVRRALVTNPLDWQWSSAG